MSSLKTPRYIVTVPFESVSDSPETTSASDEPTPIIPEEIENLLGEPALIGGEDISKYESMRCMFFAAITPKGPIEWWWVQDVVDLNWDIARYRRLRDDAIRVAQLSTAEDAAAAILRRRGEPNPRVSARAIVEDWGYACDAQESGMRSRLHSGFHAAELTAPAVMKQLETVERYDRLIASAMARRDAVLREIERTRDSFARRLRDVTDVIVEPQPKKAQPAPGVDA